MASTSYSFLDMVVLDEVRERFALGDALAVLSPALDEILWANGAGAIWLGFADIEAAIGERPRLPPTALRQIAAAPGFPHVGRDRTIALRVANGLKSRMVMLQANTITLPRGEEALLLALPAPAAEQQEQAERAIAGFDEPGHFAALLEADGTVAAASAGFDELGIDRETLQALVQDVSRENTRLVKTRITARKKIPAGIARLTDEPARHLLVVVDDGTAAPEEASLQEGSAPEPGEVKEDDIGGSAPSDTSPSESGSAPNAVETQSRPSGEVPAPRTVRFSWRTDAEGRFSALSDEFAEAMGKNAADVIGRTFREVSNAFGLDTDGSVARLLERRDTWSGRTVMWPLEGTDLKVPVDLAALPIYGRGRVFEGFRGFGIARLGEAEVDAEAIGTVLAPSQPSTETAMKPAPENGEVAEESSAPSEDARTAEPEPEADPFLGERPAISISSPKVHSGDKVIRLAEHREGGWNGTLSASERIAFREIGERLRQTKDVQPAGTGEKRSGRMADELPPANRQPDAPPPENETPVAAAFAGDTPSLAEVGGEEPERKEASEEAVADDVSKIDEAAAAPEAEQPNPSAEAPETQDDQTATTPQGLSDVEAQAETAPEERRETTPPTEADAGPAQPAAEAPVPKALTPENDEEAPTSPVQQVEEEAAPEELLPDTGGQSEIPSRVAYLPSAFYHAAAERAASDAEIAVLANLPLPVLVHSGDRLHYANREFLRLTGYTDLAALETAGGIGALFEESAVSSEAPKERMRLRTAEGAEVAVEAHLQSIHWERGKALMLALRPAAPGEPTPEEAAKAAELEGRLSEMRAIVDTATDGIAVIGNDGTIRSINRPAEALFGFDAEHVTGKPFTSLFAIESQRTVQDYLTALLDNGVASVLNDGRQVIGREAQGRFIPLFITIGRLPNGSGYCAVLRDITHWKRAEEELTQARAQAERASSQKSEFLARVSHEIRTPLNAIIGFSELMIDEKFGPIGNERYRDYLRDINRSGNHVLDLVNDLLDISKIEAGQQEMQYEAVSLNDTLAQVVAMMQPQANSERVIIRSSLASRLPDVVADLRSVRQIAINLLSNAVRYTPAGGQVIVSTAYEQDGSVILRVRDTGVGMSSAELDEALKPFRQINALRRKRGDGTGLGLPLTRAMVEANRAQFSIASTPGEGTLVEITFPPTRVLAE
ncbi:PAS domain S-box protein [Chelativorans sp. AA-79]|uniref:PAS domain S-box protein n=1 Tax=Chelativorans sp. AA-79 TaxID=3028735 RepID=UPI0023FA047A|nr:PAS domain S-box protein [Chelativorans sp. AA-79]WEX08810.1 PAS domain S-box protein [Chelativorans sp. AA-79]